jgi:alpha-galactosidase
MVLSVAHLRIPSTDAVFVWDDGFPELVHFGPPLGSTPRADLFTRWTPPAGLDAPASPTLVADTARGWFGEAGVTARRDGVPCALHATPVDARHDDTSATWQLADVHNAVALAISAALDETGVLRLSAAIANTGDTPLEVGALGITVPLPDDCTELVTIGGRWAMEACEERRPWGRTVQVVSSNRGRSSHQQHPTVLAGTTGFGENRGTVWGVHLAWHGGHRIVCDAVTADRRTVSVHPAIGADDLVLGPGESYSGPEVLVARSDRGLSGVTRAFHSHLRATSPRVERPVIVNTWEAVYFDHDFERLAELARRAARCGAERFVLDDGWFLGRRHDRAGLGDWIVDPGVWPDGLAPIVDLVNDLGMDFGLWVEPEMVNPDSELCRARPDWVLADDPQRAPLGRNQLVLDLSRPDVRDHLVGAVSSLLDGHRIAHLKWDHNRDVVTPRPHSHARGLDEVIARIRASHPEVVVESCASGGGRIDAGIARHAARFWTSDSIDALDRLRIGRGTARVVPPEMLGAHVGAPTCHTTGRRHRLGFRALSALPWWFGIEWNLLEASESELEGLARAVAVHKRYRPLLHTADTVFIDHPDPDLHLHAAVAPDRREALLIVARTANGPRHDSAPLRVPSLDPDLTYSVEPVDLGHLRWAPHRSLPDWVGKGTRATGAHLEHVGLPAVPLLPASGIVVRLVAS